MSRAHQVKDTENTVTAQEETNTCVFCLCFFNGRDTHKKILTGSLKDRKRYLLSQRTLWPYTVHVLCKKSLRHLKKNFKCSIVIHKKQD